MAARRTGPMNAHARISHATNGVLLAVAALVAVLLVAPSCDQSNGTTAPDPGAANSAQPAEVKKESVKIDGKTFKLETALDDKTRYKGLSDRTEIDEKGGMLFVFPRPIPKLHFVMRDCPIPIDIIFLDAAGRITAMHAMVPDTPRGPGERKDVEEEDRAYNERLTKYPSDYASQFVIELKGGTLKTLNLKKGQRIDIDTKRLIEACGKAQEAERAAANTTKPAGTR